MADTIDSLRIEIDSQATKANKSIDNLVKKLNTLSTAIKSIEKVNLTNFTQGINQFSNSMQKMQNVKAEQFATIANGIKKISTIDSAKLNAVSVGLKNLSTGLNGFNNISYNFGNLSNLSNAINQLGYKASGKGTGNLSKIKTDLIDFINGLNSVGSINFDMTGLSNLISSLNKLGGKAATQATANLKPMKEQILQFVSGLNGLGTINFDMSGLSSLVSSLSKLGGKTVTNAITNIPLLADKLKYLMQVLSTAPSINQNIIQMTNALANLASQGNKVGTASKGLVSGLNRTNNAMKSSKKQALSLAAAFGKFYASYFLVIRGIKKLWSSIESSMNYIETLNYFNQAFRQVADNADVSAWKEYGYKSAEAYADSFAERSKQLAQKLTGYEISDRGDLTRTDFPSLGLDPEKTMQYQATFAQMSSSMGVASETALKLSNALTMIGADLASVRNMNFTDVWDDMTSGLVGMSRTWDKYGVNIREVNLQQKLNELGIQANISSLNQQDKAILRTIILLDSTRYAWGDLANTINAPANQLRVLQANFQSLARTIGSLFLPVITAVLPYINALIIAVQRLFSWIAGLFGINLSSFVSSVGSSAVDMGALADEADDTASGIDSAADSAEKLRKSLASYDELNVVPEKTDTSTGGGAGGGGGIGDMSALNAALDEILNEYQKAWDEAFAEMQNNANEIADNITNAFKAAYDEALRLFDLFSKGFTIGFGDTSVLGDLQKEFNKLFGNLKDIFSDTEVVSAFKDWIDTLATTFGQQTGAFVSIGATLTDNLLGGINKYLSKNKSKIKTWLIDMFDISGDIMTLGADFTTALADVFSVFRSDSAKQITADIIEIFANGFMGATELAAKFIRDIAGMLLTPFIENAEKIKEALNNTLEPLSVVFDTIANGVTETFDKLNQVYDENIEPLFTSLGEGFTKIWGTLLDGYNNYLAPVLDNLAQKFSVVWESNLQPLINNAIELLGEAFELIKNLWETILQPLFDWIASEIMPALSPIVEMLGGALLDGIADVADKINITIKALKLILEVINAIFEFDWGGLWDSATKAFKDAAQSIDETLTNIKNWVTTKFGEVSEFISDTWNGIFEFLSGIWQDIFDTSSGKVDEISKKLSETWDKIKTTVSEKWGLIKSTISGLVSNIYTDVSGKFDNIKTNITNKLTAAYDSVKKIFDDIKNAITDKINAAKDAVSAGIDKIKGILDFDWELPDLKLPHFKITGSFGLTPPTTPKVSVDWYAKGAVFDKPSLIGVGEAGKEAVMPLERNTGWIDNLADSISIKLSDRLMEWEAAGEQPPVNVNVTIEGEMKKFIKAIKDENSSYQKQTGRSIFST